MNLRDIEKKKKKLNITTKEAVVSNSIIANVLKEISDSCNPVLQQIWNDKILKNYQFSENVKSQITPVFKQDDKILAKN